MRPTGIPIVNERAGGRPWLALTGWFRVATARSVGGALASPVVGGWIVDAHSWSAAFAFAGGLDADGVLVTSAPPRA